MINNALIIDDKDNVAVVIDNIKQGDTINYELNKNKYSLISVSEIEIYHKVAIKDIKVGDSIVKYGQYIGLASSDIKSGEHVHEHNVTSHRIIL